MTKDQNSKLEELLFPLAIDDFSCDQCINYTDNKISYCDKHCNSHDKFKPSKEAKQELKNLIKSINKITKS